MARTTAAAQRDLMVTAVAGLLPTNLQHVRFQQYDERSDKFREWCEANKTASFRRFSIHDVGSVPPGEINDLVQVEHSTEVELVCAYPNDHRYGSRMYLDLEKVLWEDLNQIDDTIGTAGFATFGDAACNLVNKGVEAGENVMFAVARFTLRFFRAVA